MRRPGRVLFQFEPPETLYVTYLGTVDGQTVRASRLDAQPLLRQLRRHFLIFDVRQLQSITADGRLATVERPPEGTSPLRGVAVVGATFHFRTIGTMMARAAEVLYGHVNNPIRFFDTEEEARGWLDERRQSVQDE
ncbi:MAG TPA: STAS/SEC14 domain-containing protein [Polyangium sp.]|nr:STAS/SEC14 domain-containing protein [Polyangium sp.]